jgi:mercuric ion binding protein
MSSLNGSDPKESVVKHRLILIATALLALAPFSARAAEKTVVLNVHHAYCALCPSIVTKTLQQVSGVRLVAVTKPDAAGNMAATVTFDDAASDATKLIAATTNAGYPAELKN